MANTKSRKGGKRKIGRMAKSPAHARYNGERRWEKNKERRIAKQAKKEAKKKKRQKAKKLLTNDF